MTTKYLLSPEETADALSLSRSTVYLELASGRLESIRCVRARRIAVDAVERWLESKREEAAEPNAA